MDTSGGGACGTGKTTLAVALEKRAVANGLSVRRMFPDELESIIDIAEADLLIIDECNAGQIKKMQLKIILAAMEERLGKKSTVIVGHVRFTVLRDGLTGLRKDEVAIMNRFYRNAHEFNTDVSFRASK
ncbi:MAG: ATP-binding protein [Candidatus Riflebacteria bacterium]|nr:ATP-binding protein [Candidatus Riflebacteria bacterium]